MKKSHLLSLLSLIALVAACLLWASPRSNLKFSGSHPVTQNATGSSSVKDSATSENSINNNADTAHLSLGAMSIHQSIEAALMELQSGDPLRQQAALEMLNSLLSGDGHDAKAAIAAIMAFLRSGRDAQTGESFLVGEGGVLDHAPTLRSLLMDHLGSLCLEAGQMDALEIAREVLGKFGSADEWAVCLRNTAWLDANSTSFLAQKMEQMLSHEAWLQNPSRGLLESFDVIGAIGATALMPQLERFLLAESEGPLWRAGVVALDQLAANHPQETMEYLTDHPDFLQDRPLQRADLFAKADMANNAQRTLIEAYLGNPAISAEERGKVVGGLALQGGFLSHNLLTRPVNFTPESEQQRLAFLHELGSQWRGANRFPDLNPYIDDLLLTTQPPTE